MNETGRLWENVVSVYVLQGLNYLIPIMVLPYLVRTLGIGVYGLTVVAQSLAGYFVLFTDYGFNLSATRTIARQRDNLEAVSRIFCSVLITKFAILCLGFMVLAGLLAWVPPLHQHARFFLVAFIAVPGNALFPVWLFQGMQEMRYISAIYGGSRLLGAIAIFMLTHTPQDAMLALLLQSLAVVAAGLVGFSFAFRRFHLQLVRPGVEDLRSAVRGGWHLFLSTAAISLYTNTNVLLVGLLAGNVQAGYFGAAEKLVRGIQGLVTPLTQAIYPHMNLLAKQSKEMALAFAGHVLQWMGGATLAASLLLFFFARLIIPIVLGSGASGSVPVIRWIAFLPFIVATSNVFGVQTMIPFGLDRALSRIIVGAGLLHLVISVILIHALGAVGAGMALFTTELLISVLAFLILRRNELRIPLWGAGLAP